MPRLYLLVLPFALALAGFLFPAAVHAQDDELRECAEPYGTLAVVEPQEEILRMLSRYDLSSPTSLIRIMVQESNCFMVVERGIAMQNLQQERALAESGELRGNQNVGGGQMVAADFILTPDVLISDDDAGGVGGALGRFGGRGLGLLAAGVKFKEAQTSLLISDTRSGIQVASAQGKAKKRDFKIGMLGIGAGTAIAGGGYTDTAEGKVIAASFLDNFNNVIASVESNPNMDQFGATRTQTVEAGETFASGDVIAAKIDNVQLLLAPDATAETITTVTAADALVYLGIEENGYLQVQGSSGQGWINKLLVAKQ
jgi:hypothetical protein